MKPAVVGPKDPEVSKAMGMNRWLGSRWPYLASLICSALAATAPAYLMACGRFDGAKVSQQVASQTKILPLFQGIRVMPSGRFPSLR